MKKLILIAFVGLLAVSCKKYGCTDPTALNYSDVATDDDGSCFFGQSFNITNEIEYSLTFGPGNTYQYVADFVGTYQAGDVIVTYVKWAEYGGEPYWQAIPIGTASSYIYDEIANDGGFYVNVTQPDDFDTYPFVSEETFAFKSILIKGTFMEEHPGVDVYDYEELNHAIEEM